MWVKLGSHAAGNTLGDKNSDPVLFLPLVLLFHIRKVTAAPISTAPRTRPVTIGMMGTEGLRRL